MSIEEIRRKIAEKKAELEEIDRRLNPLWAERTRIILEIKELEALLAREERNSGYER